MKSIKVRIYPNNKQIKMLNQHFGARRWIYNYALEKKIKYYNNNKKSLSIYEISKELPKLKKENETLWLKDVNSQVLQQSLKDLEMAFSRFFKKTNKFPQFKSKHNPKQSFRVPQGFLINNENKTIKIPKIGIIKFRDKFKFQKILEFRSITISKKNDKFYASILFLEKDEFKIRNKIDINKILGIDLGIKIYATLSNEIKIKNPKFEFEYREKLKKAQQKLSNKQKKSKNYEKQKKIIAKIHEKITNCRKDFLHKLTTKLIDNQDYTSYAIEDLSIKNMQKDNYSACNRAIGDVAWNTFRNMLKYKSEGNNKNLLIINRFEASSKTCSCGVKNKNLTLEDRTWTCNSCGKTHDRDILAANNIKLFALIKNNLSAGHVDLVVKTI